MDPHETHTSSESHVGRLTYQNSAQYLNQLHKKPPENGMLDRLMDRQSNFYIVFATLQGHTN
ncbi:hypothetical protein DPMN_117896 [Dreissena polymorpha]|uniref:Uncharacterized protein n=1 Tax=Dreissena polymorpha TaxID=45954 RepID=A0A9D4JLD7_DREPO|nr:hypothetical protein DPMN_117896 [Dreissena polymorpha]